MATKARVTTISVNPETHARFKALCERLNITADQLLNMLLDRFDASNTTAPSATAPTTAPEIAPPPNWLADVLWILEPVVDFMTTVITVYPDLRAEAALTVEMAQRRFVEVAQAAGLIVPQPEEAPEEQETEEEAPEGTAEA